MRLRWHQRIIRALYRRFVFRPQVVVYDRRPLTFSEVREMEARDE